MPRIVPSLDTAPRDSLRYLLSAALVIAGLYVGSEIFVPIALAILLSFVLAPGVRVLRRCGIGRVLPVLLMTLLAFLLIAALATLLALQLRGLADAMPQYQTTVLDKVEALRGMVSGQGASRPRQSTGAATRGRIAAATVSGGVGAPGLSLTATARSGTAWSRRVSQAVSAWLIAPR